MVGRVGQQLGNYRLVRLLGRGGFAEVYLGQHVHLASKQAAIKILQLFDVDASKFQEEAETTEQLVHPHIVRLLDFDIEEGTSFLVLDFAPGGSLRSRHPRGSIVPLATVGEYLKELAPALQYAHDQHVLHRDIKPDNILVGRQGELLLSDFGIAVLSQTGRASLEAAYGVGGTPYYMAPEAYRGEPEKASDQYALAVVVYEWLCGSAPFSQGDFFQLAFQHVMKPVPPLREKNPTIPPEVETVIMKALAKEPKDRFASVREFATALEHASQEALSPLLSTVLAMKHPSPKSPSQTVHNLPVQSTLFLGREHEMDSLCDLLRRPEVRLATLSGPGGIGKTRLSLQVATELADQFPDGIFFVALAPVSDAGLVVPTIMQTLSISEEGTEPPLVQLKAALKDKQMLLLLDNFEQVIEAAVPVAELLAACPKLKILVSSRILLHVQAEREFAVSPLSLPNPKSLPDLKTLSQYEAVALFIQRAQVVKADFQVTNTNAPAVAAICVRLDGLPLAIELAAARVKHFPPQMLLKRLEQGLSVLSGGSRDLPARQQTLRNAIAWSYDLLTPEEQQLFRCFAAFVDGCTWEAVEEVCTAASQWQGDVLEGLVSLVDKSLLWQEESAEGEVRFRMLQLLREFGLEELAAKGELQAVREAHARYYLRLVVEAKQDLSDKGEGQLLDLLEQEYNNLRSALTWMLEGMMMERVEMAIQLCEVLFIFWRARGQISEGVTFLERIVAVGRDLEADLRAKALFIAAALAEEQGDFNRSEVHAQASLVLYRELGDNTGSANTLLQLAWVAGTRGDGATSRKLKEEAVALFDKTSDKAQLSDVLYVLADELCAQGEFARGLALFEESLALSRELGSKAGVAVVLMQSAWWIYNSQGDAAIMRARLAEALPLVREMGDKLNMATHSWVSALLAFGEKDLARARSLAEESVECFRQMERPWYIAWTLIILAQVEAQQGNAAAAQSHLEESLELSREMGDKWLTPWGLEGLAGVVAARGESAWAARLWGAAEAVRENSGFPMPPVERSGYEQAVAAVRSELGEEAFAAAWSQGRTTPLEQAIHEVLKTRGEAGR